MKYVSCGGNAEANPKFYNFQRDHLGNIRRGGRNRKDNADYSYCPFGNTLVDVSMHSEQQLCKYSSKEFELLMNLIDKASEDK